MMRVRFPPDAPNSMMRNQVELHSENSSKLVVWLDVDPRVKLGTRLTLKEIPNIYWVVTTLYNTKVDERYFHRKWNVGGIDNS